MEFFNNGGNFIILVIQACILLFQIYVTIKIDKNTRRKDRGIFCLDRRIDKSRCPILKKDDFDFELPERRHLRFIVIEASVILKESRVVVNGDIQDTLKGESVFIKNTEDDDVRIDLPLSDAVLNAGRFECSIEMQLETLSGLEYKEIVSMTFSKRDDTYWKMDKYIMRIK